MNGGLLLTTQQSQPRHYRSHTVFSEYEMHYGLKVILAFLMIGCFPLVGPAHSVGENLSACGDNEDSWVVPAASPPPKLSLTVTGSRLSAPSSSTSAVYDGNDSIYIIAGLHKSKNSDHVLKYSLESGSVTHLGNFVKTNGGSAVMVHDDDGDNILYFGGWDNFGRDHSSNVYSYSTRHQNYSVVAQMPMTLRRHLSVVWDPQDRVAYIFGASMLEEPDSEVVAKYYHVDHRVEIVGTVREPSADPLAVWYGHSGGRSGGTAFTFGTTATGLSEVIRYDFGEEGNLSAAKLATRLPYTYWLPCAVLAENIDKSIYVFGNQFRTDGFTRFDPATHEAEIVEIDGWPGVLAFAACSYVPKLGRIYIFGGWSGGLPGYYMDDISYVQLYRSGIVNNSTQQPTNVQHMAVDEYFQGNISGKTFENYFVRALIVIGLGYLTMRCLRLANRLAVSHGKSETGWDHQSRTSSSSIGTGLSPLEIQMFLKGIPKLNKELFLCRENINCQPYDRELELAEDAVKVDREDILGAGQFGIVLRGRIIATDTPVAVKTVKPQSTNNLYARALLTEIKVLNYLGQHDHIVNLVGAQTSRLNQGIVLLFVEYCPLGDLENYLRTRRNFFKDHCHGGLCTYARAALCSNYIKPEQIDHMCSGDLLRWSTQIADAMEYLASKKVIHGDLAARNVLLLDKTCAKITDFGLAKKLYNYINYIRSNEVPLPWRSMAIESLTEMNFSTQSDVWSFGVTLWEMFSLGQIPYHAATQCSLEFVAQLQNGYKLPNPKLATKELYSWILRCWSLQPSDRPNFGELKSALEELSREHRGVCCRGGPGQL